MYLTIFILFPSFALSSFVNLSTELSVAHLFTGVSWNIITAAVVAASSLFYICNRSFSLMGTPPGIPWAGNGQDVLSRARTTFRSVFGMRELIEEGYYKVSFSCGSRLTKCLLNVNIVLQTREALHLAEPHHRP